MNTTGNSSPFALCSVISVTASASGPSLSSSDDEHRALQEVIERREPDLPFLVGDRLGGARDQLAHVVEAVRRLGSLGAQILGVADRVDDLAEQLVDRRLARRLAEPRDRARRTRASAARAAGRSAPTRSGRTAAASIGTPAARAAAESCSMVASPRPRFGTAMARRNASSSAGFATSLR